MKVQADQHGAFVGVSLDSSQFSRGWVRMAVPFILARHGSLLFVLADRLLTFNKSALRSDSGAVVLSLSSADVRISKRTGDVAHFLRSEIARLAAPDQARVAVRSWDDYADEQFSSILRVLSIAYAAIGGFRACVDRDVEVHASHQPEGHVDDDACRRLCALYVLEETAMIIRITEDGHPFEYYPQHHIHTLTELYSDRFSDYGLRVEDLIGRSRTRVFSPLPLPDSD